jgi:hypothetical protein
VAGVAFGRQGLNDAGEIVFKALLNDGRRVIVRATPRAAAAAN